MCPRCGAGKEAYKDVFGICGRTSLLEYNRFLDLKELFNYKIKSCYSLPLPIKTSFIPVLDRDIRKYKLPDYFPDIDVWAVQMHDVYNIKKRKFVSNDIKDFFSISNNNKLLLSTNSTDNYQELLWKKRFSFDFTSPKFDYWFPGHFSIYDNDNKLYQFINAKRQQIHSELSKSQFVWFRLGENIPVSFMQPIKMAKNILISTNNMKSQSSINILQKEILFADDLFPMDASFFVIGGISNFPKLKVGRKYYIVGTQWCKNAVFGNDLSNNIHVKFSKHQKKDMLIMNLNEEVDNARKNYSKLHGRRTTTEWEFTQGKFEF